MMLVINRIAGNEHGTFGVLSVRADGRLYPFALTLEPEDHNNEPNISCIPSGEYVCRRVDSPKYGDTFEITDVPGRTHVLIHWGNVEENTRGCVLVGEMYEPLNGKPGVLSSKKAFAELLDKTRDVNEFILLIVESYKAMVA